MQSIDPALVLSALAATIAAGAAVVAHHRRPPPFPALPKTWDRELRIAAPRAGDLSGPGRGTHAA
jgi:hypothetical protein